MPKLCGQIAAALIPVLAGVRVENLTLPFLGGFELHGWAYPLTVLGIVAVANVINFLDGEQYVELPCTWYGVCLAPRRGN